MNRHKDIFEADPPFLVVYPNNEWKVAVELVQHAKGVAFVEPFSHDGDDKLNIVSGSAWHLGENVWEFDYATKITTLDHPNYHKHPAWRLWLSWLQHQHNEREHTSH